MELTKQRNRLSREWGITARFQEQIEMNYCRNVLNFAVSAFGQEEADNLSFALPLRHHSVILLPTVVLTVAV